MATDYIENEVSFNYEDPISRFSEFRMARNSTQVWIPFKNFDTFIELVDESQRTIRATLSDVI
jgi:hypothetical protein